MEPLAYTVEDAARMLTIGRNHMYQLIRRGEIVIVKIGSRTVVPAESLECYLANKLERARLEIDSL